MMMLTKVVIGMMMKLAKAREKPWKVWICVMMMLRKVGICT